MKRQRAFAVRRAAARFPKEKPRAMRLVGSALAATTFALMARRARALSPGGAMAATGVGTLTLIGGGFRGGAALVAFFVSSTLLGKLPGSKPLQQQRGNERDTVQVLANGGIASLLALASAVGPPPTGPIFKAGFAGAVAAAAADTWATEFGSRSARPPRSLATLQPVSHGASGGVTWAGLASSAVGAAMIAGIVSTGARRQHGPSSTLPRAVILAGFSGALVDSLLGATVQQVRYCDACRRETELRVHDCGQPTRLIRGFSWCDNDMVNAIATAVGAAVAMSVSHRARNRIQFDNTWSKEGRVRFPRDV